MDETKNLLDLKKQEYFLLQKKKELQEQLPHLYSYKWYSWAKKFFESRKKLNLLCAANQISKSSTQIRKVIHWATETKLWPMLWKSQPRQFWYLYPSFEIALTEFESKWVPEFLPKEMLKDHPKYGWKIIKIKNKFAGLRFNTGVDLYFKTYSQDVLNLQAGTVHYIAADEELPIDLFDELIFRMAASNGYFSMVFTATIGQEFWYRALERVGMRDETLKGALKQQISMYDCLTYEDGTESIWTEKKINQIKNQCKSEAEIQRRVYGRFIKDTGLKYPCFVKDRNVIQPAPVPKEWLIYSGVDIGSGRNPDSNKPSHAAAIIFVAVRPDYQYGVVFRGWVGINTLTTASDILEIYRTLRGNLKPIMQCYDWAAKDFYTYASRLGESFTKADKSHDLGEDVINVLFKNKMLAIHDLEELQGLMVELSSVSKDIVKRFAKDDFVDALRYAVTLIPWDWSVISDELVIEEKKREEALSETEKRRRFVFDDGLKELETHRIEYEIEEYNNLVHF